MVKDESDIQTIRDAAPQSDYDILVVVTDSYSQRGRMRLGTDYRRELALAGIDADIRVKVESQIEDYADKPGSVIHAAPNEGGGHLTQREHPELVVHDQVILEQRLRNLTGCAVQYRYPDELS